jgi:hypothetical protein
MKVREKKEFHPEKRRDARAEIGDFGLIFATHHHHHTHINNAI